MTTTRRLFRDEWQPYFDDFTKRFLRDEREQTVQLELLSQSLGDQIAVRDTALRGISWDPKDMVLEVVLEDELDHLVLHPKQVSVIEEDDGFVKTIDVERDDGAHEIIELRRYAPLVRPETRV